jgi:hypothetical protein
VLDGKGFTCDSTDLKRFPQLDVLSFFDGKLPDAIPYLVGCKDRHRRSVLKTAGMIGVRMGDQNRLGPQIGLFVQPVLTAVDHNGGSVLGDPQCTVAVVAAGARLNVSPGSHERELHNMFIYQNVLSIN